MAFTPARVVVILACLAAFVAVVSSDDHSSREDIVTLQSTLLGRNEIPKNNTDAARNAVGDLQGVVYMKLYIYREDKTPKWLKYTVKATKLNGEMPPTKTHVHPGKKGENKAVLLDLPCNYEKKGSAEWRCEGKLGKSKGDRTDALLSALKAIAEDPNGHYGNIHTKRYPDGAVRGQFAKE